MAVELFAPFVSPYEFFEGMGIRSWPNGHGHTGTADSIHAAYSPVPGYWDQMKAAYGEQRDAPNLALTPHASAINAEYFDLWVEELGPELTALG